MGMGALGKATIHTYPVPVSPARDRRVLWAYVKGREVSRKVRDASHTEPYFCKGQGMHEAVRLRRKAARRRRSHRTGRNQWP
jgi:hypothetical protein